MLVFFFFLSDDSILMYDESKSNVALDRKLARFILKAVLYR